MDAHRHQDKGPDERSRASASANAMTLDDEDVEVVEGTRGDASKTGIDDLIDIGPGDVLDGKYRLDERLGEGGMAIVFRAHHLQLGRDVAVKVLLREWCTNALVSARFDREARCIARLKHPNCVQVLDYGTSKSKVPYMVVELIEGATLADRLGAPFSLVRALAIMVGILRGLEHAHGHGIVHRDLKPDNVLLTRDHKGRDLAKILDFGIAKIENADPKEEAALTKMGVVFGTPEYMSPEQAMGMEIDARTDLYSAGLVLYEMLAGRPAFEGNDALALVTMRAMGKPAPLPDNIPSKLRAFVFRLLARRPEGRFARATEALVRLTALQHEIASSTRPPPPPVNMTRRKSDRRAEVAPPPAKEPEPRSRAAETDLSALYGDALDDVIADSEEGARDRLSDEPVREPNVVEPPPIEDLAPVELAYPEETKEPPRRSNPLLGPLALLMVVVMGCVAWWWGFMPSDGP